MSEEIKETIAEELITEPEETVIEAGIQTTFNVDSIDEMNDDDVVIMDAVMEDEEVTDETNTEEAE